MADDDKNEKHGFTVKDRRINFEDDNADNVKQEESRESEPIILSGGKEPEKEKEAAEDKPLPPIDFAQFVMSLATSAMIHLGDIPHPADGQRHVELEAAQETIDILGILEEKTRGNLSREEESLIKDVIADLRIRYVSKKAKK